MMLIVSFVVHAKNNNFFVNTFKYMETENNRDDRSKQRYKKRHKKNRGWSDRVKRSRHQSNNNRNDRKYFYNYDDNDEPGNEFFDFQSLDTIKHVSISMNGKWIAKVLQNDEEEWVVLRMPKNKEKRVFTAESSEIIEGICFVGSEYLMITLKETKSSKWDFKVINLHNVDNKIVRFRNLKSIKNDKLICVTPSKKKGSTLVGITRYNGRFFVTRIIDLRTGKILSEHISAQIDVFDTNLNVRISFKTSRNRSGYDVYVDGRFLEHIEDINEEKYVAYADNICYKLTARNGAVVLFGLDLGERKKSFKRLITVEDVTVGLGSCFLNLDSEGKPFFLTVGLREKARNFPIADEAVERLDFMKDFLEGASWRRIATGARNNIWTIAVYDEQPENPQYLKFDWRNKNVRVSEITADGIQDLDSRGWLDEQNGDGEYEDGDNALMVPLAS